MADCIFESEKMLVFQAQLGEWDNLNHLLVCKKTNKAVIVDPFFSDYWLRICSDRGWELDEVWLTHTHWDHAKGVEGLKDKIVWVHEYETQRGWDGPSNREWSMEANNFVNQKIGELEFEAHCTPGHTPGHMVFIGEGVVVSGDCLFLGRCGRTDLFGGDSEAQRRSLHHLRTRLSVLPSNWIVLPGHIYPLEDGSNPTYTTVEKLLSNNEAIAAIDDDYAWNNLEFLAFDDDLAEKARRQRASTQ